eukprot:Rmarinus@m.12055
MNEITNNANTSSLDSNCGHVKIAAVKTLVALAERFKSKNPKEAGECFKAVLDTKVLNSLEEAYVRVDFAKTILSCSPNNQKISDARELLERAVELTKSDSSPMARDVRLHGYSVLIRSYLLHLSDSLDNLESISKAAIASALQNGTPFWVAHFGSLHLKCILAQHMFSEESTAWCSALAANASDTNTKTLFRLIEAHHFSVTGLPKKAIQLLDELHFIPEASTIDPLEIYYLLLRIGLYCGDEALLEDPISREGALTLFERLRSIVAQIEEQLARHGQVKVCPVGFDLPLPPALLSAHVSFFASFLVFANPLQQQEEAINRCNEAIVCIGRCPTGSFLEDALTAEATAVLKVLVYTRLTRLLLWKSDLQGASHAAWSAIKAFASLRGSQAGRTFGPMLLGVVSHYGVAFEDDNSMAQRVRFLVETALGLEETDNCRSLSFTERVTFMSLYVLERVRAMATSQLMGKEEAVQDSQKHLKATLEHLSYLLESSEEAAKGAEGAPLNIDSSRPLASSPQVPIPDLTRTAASTPSLDPHGTLSSVPLPSPTSSSASLPAACIGPAPSLLRIEARTPASSSLGNLSRSAMAAGFLACGLGKLALHVDEEARVLLKKCIALCSSRPESTSSDGKKPPRPLACTQILTHALTALCRVMRRKDQAQKAKTFLVAVCKEAFEFNDITTELRASRLMAEILAEEQPRDDECLQSSLDHLRKRRRELSEARMAAVSDDSHHKLTSWKFETTATASCSMRAHTQSASKRRRMSS